MRFGRLSIAVRLCTRLGEETSLPLRRYLPVGFPAGVRIRWQELQFAVPPATGSLSFTAATSHPLQRPL